MNSTIIFTILLISICIIDLYYIREDFNINNRVYIAQPSKCFSCENQLTKKLKYMGGPSKCFSCEKELLNSNIDPNLAQPTKCFSCEKQFK